MSTKAQEALRQALDGQAAPNVKIAGLQIKYCDREWGKIKLSLVLVDKDRAPLAVLETLYLREGESATLTELDQVFRFRVVLQ